MALQAGELLIHRMQVTLGTGDTDVDTGVTQANLGVQPDPPVGGSSTVPSRIMVKVLPPIDNWSGITISEPVLDPGTNTVHVTFTNPGAAAVVNVLIWDPHTLMGPVDADLYAVPPPPPSGAPPVSLEQGFGGATHGGF
jgi:hypothetical protein